MPRITVRAVLGSFMLPAARARPVRRLALLFLMPLSCTTGSFPEAGPGGGGQGGHGGQAGGAGRDASAEAPSGSAGSGGGGSGGGPGGGGAGEPCSEIDATRDCSPAPCRRGTQICERASGTAWTGVWSPCRDVVTVPGCTMPDAPCDCAKPTAACEEYCKGRDGGADGGAPPPTCVCVAGDTRWCHVDGSCVWGRQSCLPDGRWGPCGDAGGAKVPAGCTAGTYSFCCCVKAGQCCEDDGDGAFEGGHGPSGGKCPSASCGGSEGPRPWDWPPKTASCPGAGECVPGGKRYCYYTGDLKPPFGQGEAVCQPDGRWGLCTFTASPHPALFACFKGSDPLPAGVPGGPRSRWKYCCAKVGLCCAREIYTVGCSENWSYGACDGIACR